MVTTVIYVMKMNVKIVSIIISMINKLSSANVRKDTLLKIAIVRNA